MIRRLAVVAMAFLWACQRDYRFHTLAVYEATRGGYSIRVDGQGVVRAGHDISENATGVLVVSPSGAPGPGGPAPVSVAVALRGSRVQFDTEWRADGSGPAPGTVVVSRRLSQGGYSVYPDELEELVSASEGVLLGPKGTLMSGQTKVLRVVSITFDR